MVAWDTEAILAPRQVSALTAILTLLNCDVTLSPLPHNCELLVKQGYPGLPGIPGSSGLPVSQKRCSISNISMCTAASYM